MARVGFARMGLPGDHVRIFELHLADGAEIRVDNRKIVAAEFVCPRVAG
ncbi:MAG: hypothetical protein JO110_17540 [Acetobacteraceae bacterium]|nr:hypothetical protein [Acetobacteraceae bacterium]